MILFLWCLFLGCFVGVVAVIFVVVKQWWYSRYIGSLPRLKGQLPVIGYSHKLLGQDSSKIIGLLKEATEDVPSPAVVWLGPILVVAVYDIETVHKVLNADECLSKGYLYDFFTCPRGLFNSKDEIWRGHRKALKMTFNTKLVNSFVPNFCYNTDLMIDEMRTVCDTGKSCNLLYYSFVATLNMISGNHLLYNHNFFKNYGAWYQNISDEGKRLVIMRGLCVWKFPEWIYKLTSDYKKLITLFTAGREYIYKNIIEPKAKEVAERKTKNLDPYETAGEGGIRYLTRAIQLYDQGVFDREDLEAEVETIMVTGNETTGVAIPAICLMLAMHSDIQEKCYEEIKRVFHNEPVAMKGYSIPLEKLKELSYIEMVIKETLRLHPVGPFILRECRKDLNMGDFTIPSHTHILISIMNMHRSKEYWGSNVMEFYPERFAPENYQKVPSGAFIPFSAGPRNCLGFKYAMLSMMVLMAKLISNFEFKTNRKENEVKPTLELTMCICRPDDIMIYSRN